MNRLTINDYIENNLPSTIISYRNTPSNRPKKPYTINKKKENTAMACCDCVVVLTVPEAFPDLSAKNVKRINI